MREAAAALRLTAQDLHKLGVVDKVVKEPVGGAQRDPDAAIKSVGKAIAAELKALSAKKPDDLRKQRRKKFLDMGQATLQ